MESCSSAWGREGLSRARSSSQPWEGAVGALGVVWGPCRNWGWHSQAAASRHRAHPSLPAPRGPAPSGHSGKGSGQAAPASAPSARLLPAQPRAKPRPGSPGTRARSSHRGWGHSLEQESFGKHRKQDGKPSQDGEHGQAAGGRGSAVKGCSPLPTSQMEQGYGLWKTARMGLPVPLREWHCSVQEWH